MSSKEKKKIKQNTVSEKTSVHVQKPSHPLVWLSGILIITFIAFSPVLKNGFTNWDDNVYIGENPLITNISGENIKKIFSTKNFIVESRCFYIRCA